MEVEVIPDSSWNNLSSYKDISVSLGGRGEQVGPVKIRAILCSLKNRFGLTIVIFFSFLKEQVCSKLKQIVKDSLFLSPKTNYSSSLGLK